MLRGEARTCIHHLLPQRARTTRKDGPDENPLVTMIEWGELPTLSRPKIPPTSRRRLAQPACRFLSRFRRITIGLPGGPRLPMAESTHKRRSAATARGCSQSVLAAARPHLPILCRRPVIVVRRGPQLLRNSTPGKPLPRERQMTHTLPASGKYRRALIPGLYFLGRRSRGLRLVRRPSACQGCWGRNGSRTKALLIAGTARWRT
jgi:hypothetical protein